jgi:hypothetical protein
MANKNEDPPSWLRQLLGRMGPDADAEPMGNKYKKIGAAGLLTTALGMGIQSRKKKKDAFQKANDILDYDRKRDKEDFKQYRKDQRALPKDKRYQKDGGTVFSRKSRITDYNGKKKGKGKK